MPVSKKITKFLDENKYKHQIIEHRTTYTAWDTAQTEHVKPREIGKALIMKMDNNYAVALIPANKNLDKKKFLKIYNTEMKKREEKIARKADFAKEAWMKKNLLGKVGATPPFGNLIKLKIFADRSLLKEKKIYLGSGEYNASIFISSKEYEKKENPILGSFSVAKK